jgi:hypothetical protein
MDPREWNQQVAGEYPHQEAAHEVFRTVCEAKCPDVNGPDNEPTQPMCVAHICPTLKRCVVRGKQIVGFGGLMECIGGLAQVGIVNF